jgi:hypothetical protein
VGFNDANDDVDPILGLFASGEQHLVGFANARRGAEKDFQLAALLPMRVFK